MLKVKDISPLGPPPCTFGSVLIVCGNTDSGGACIPRNCRGVVLHRAPSARNTNQHILWNVVLVVVEIVEVVIPLVVVVLVVSTSSINGSSNSDSAAVVVVV